MRVCFCSQVVAVFEGHALPRITPCASFQWRGPRMDAIFWRVNRKRCYHGCSTSRARLRLGRYAMSLATECRWEFLTVFVFCNGNPEPRGAPFPQASFHARRSAAPATGLPAHRRMHRPPRLPAGAFLSSSSGKARGPMQAAMGEKSKSQPRPSAAHEKMHVNRTRPPPTHRPNLVFDDFDWC